MSGEFMRTRWAWFRPLRLSVILLLMVSLNAAEGGFRIFGRVNAAGEPAPRAHVVLHPPTPREIW